MQHIVLTPKVRWTEILLGFCLLECDIKPGNKRLSLLPLPRNEAARLLIGALIRAGAHRSQQRSHPGNARVLLPSFLINDRPL